MSEPLVIKKYPNRKLYNSESSRYVNFKDLMQLLQNGRELKIVDQRTRQDLTKEVFEKVFHSENKEFLQQASKEQAFTENKKLNINLLKP